MQGTGSKLPPRASLPMCLCLAHPHGPRASSTTGLHHGPHHPALHHGPQPLPRRRTRGARSQPPCRNPARRPATSNANGANQYQHQHHGLPPDHSHQYQRSPSEPASREACRFRQPGLLDPKRLRIRRCKTAPIGPLLQQLFDQMLSPINLFTSSTCEVQACVRTYLADSP